MQDSRGVTDESRWRVRRSRLRRSAAALAFAIIGGCVTVSLLFAGFGFGAPVVGLVTTLGLAGALASRAHRSGAGLHLLGYSFAFALLTWPTLLVGASLFWGHWE